MLARAQRAVGVLHQDNDIPNYLGRARAPMDGHHVVLNSVSAWPAVNEKARMLIGTKTALLRSTDTTGSMGRPGHGPSRAPHAYVVAVLICSHTVPSPLHQGYDILRL